MVRGWRIKVKNKKADVVYTRDTPFIEYLEDLRRIDICPEAREFYENAYLENPSWSISKILNKYVPLQSWSKSMLEVYGSQLEEGVRRIFLDQVNDTVMNYRLWKSLENITDKEREMLREKFRGKLPNIERKL